MPEMHNIPYALSASDVARIDFGKEGGLVPAVV